MRTYAKRLVLIVSGLLVLLALLSACSEEEIVPVDRCFTRAAETYIRFAEASLKDWPKAVEDYCHFEDAEAREKTLKGEENWAYKIIRFEKLSDELWEVEAVTYDERTPNGIYGVNYVGMIDGAWRVMTGIRQIPAALKEGITIKPYQPHGEDAVDPGDVIK